MAGMSSRCYNAGHRACASAVAAGPQSLHAYIRGKPIIPWDLSSLGRRHTSVAVQQGRVVAVPRGAFSLHDEHGDPRAVAAGHEPLRRLEVVRVKPLQLDPPEQRRLRLRLRQVQPAAGSLHMVRACLHRIMYDDMNVKTSAAHIDT